MRITADTNSFLAVTMAEPERDLIVELTTGCELAAPDVLPYEIGNALTAMLKKGTLLPEEVASIWDRTQSIAVELHPIDIRSALQLAAQFKIYAYDACFLECSRRLNTPLLTLDKGLRYIAPQIGIPLLGEFS